MMKKAFSLIELSIVILIIGILIAGVTQGSRLVNAMRLAAARSQTQSSPVFSIRNVTVWFDAASEKAFDEAEMENGLSITNWYSIIPQSTAPKITISGTNKPIYSTNGINNLPALLYNGTNSCLYSATNAVSASDIVNTKNVTAFVVQNFTGAITKTTTSLWLAVTASSSPRLNISAPETSGLNVDMGDVERTSYAITSALMNRPVVISTVRNNTVGEIRMNGGAALASTTGMVTNMPSASSGVVLSVGCIDPAVNTTYSFQGYIAEVIIFDRALKVEERQAVEQYLGKKWGIKIS